MLEEKEFFVRKAIGWVLREVAKRRPDLVADWLGPRVHRASGVTVREAVKYLPDDSPRPPAAGYQARNRPGPTQCLTCYRSRQTRMTLSVVVSEPFPGTDLKGGRGVDDQLRQSF